MANTSDNKQASNSKKLLENGLSAVGFIARDNLERFGALLDGLNAKSGKPSKFNAVDLSKFEARSHDNQFSQQTLKASKQLIGNRFATYGKFAKKVVPDSIFQKITDTAFAQVARLAASWSKLDLPNQHRFQGIQALDEQQRNALARDIANQNRAFATLGSVSGLMGLPGLLADSLWLLLVSLRTVYQLAVVYDKPLTGKQGIKMAYAVISNADLSKMQEKQTLLAGLGVAQTLLANAEHEGLRQELIGKGVGGNNVQFYAEQIDKIAEQFNFDIDDINLSWLNKLIPLTAVAVAAHYNNYLIEQVIGVAQATFGPEPITAKKIIADDTQTDEQDSVNADSSNQNDSNQDSQTDGNGQSESTEKADSEQVDSAKKDTVTDNVSGRDNLKNNAE